MSGEAEKLRQGEEPCAPWCQLAGATHDTCARELLRETGPSQPGVMMTWKRDGSWPNVVVLAGELTVVLALPTAQGVATLLAYLAPSTRTATVAQAFQRAATHAFPPLGYPEHGPVEGAHNPWKAGPRLGELLDGDRPAGA